MPAHHHPWCVSFALSIEVASCALWSFGWLPGGALLLKWIAVIAAEPCQSTDGVSERACSNP